MTDGQIKAMFTMLEYIAKMTAENRADLKIIKEKKTKEAGKLRRELAKLKANKTLSKDVHRLLSEFLNPEAEPADERSVAAVKRDFAIHKGGHRDD